MNISTGVKQALILALGIIVLGDSVNSGLKSLAGKDRKVVVKGLAEKGRNRQTLWGGCTDANPKLLLNDT